MVGHRGDDLRSVGCVVPVVGMLFVTTLTDANSAIPEQLG
jgi:hypothetical protein